VPYVYEVSFEVAPDQMDELQVGSSLGRVVGYLRALLPNEHGFVTSTAMYSIDDPARTSMVLRSEWGSWEALEKHRSSATVEAKVLEEFAPHLPPESLTTRVYAEVGPKPY
jgi:quinol monooxygenase YgiN